VPVPAGWTPFIHLCPADGEIAFQASQPDDTFAHETEGRLAVTAVGWVPEDLKPGEEFELVYGIYDRRTGERLELSGSDLGDHRIRAGHLLLKGDGDAVSDVGWRPYGPKPDPFAERWNVDGRPVNFGSITTAGGCRVQPEGQNALRVTPLPDPSGSPLMIEIRGARLPWGPRQPTRIEWIEEDGSVQKTHPAILAGGILTLEAETAPFAFRIK